MDPCHVTLEGRTPIRQNGGAKAIAAGDVCLTPSPAGMVPVPYVNVAQAASLTQGSSTVTIGGASVMLGQSILKESSGNEAGTGGGIISKTTRGRAQATATTCTVWIEGQKVVRNGDTTSQNKGNAVGCIAGGH